MTADPIPADISPQPQTVGSVDRLPSWYPDWARQLAELYFSGTTCLFVLHGNVHDLIARSDGENIQFCNLTEFLASQVFGNWDIVLRFDLGQGLRPMAGAESERLKAMLKHVTALWGEPTSWPRDADKVLFMLDRLVERTLIGDSSGARKSIAVVLDYSQYLVPSGDVNMLARGQAARLVQMLGWAQNPYIKRVNIAFCLITDQLAELNDRLVQNPHVATIEIPLPDIAARRRFAESVMGDSDLSANSDFTIDELAEVSSGLSLINLNMLLSQAKSPQRRVDAAQFSQLKKTMIERQCGNLLEFVEPSHTLDLVVGHEAAKQRLEHDAHWISRGRRDTAPMGYLLCGPVGTGKSFLAECYAGSIGIPCVKLRNFRSKYVGETEGNLQRIFNVLRSLGPVVVIIDEADAALGSRSSEGDSGTSNRIFSMIASQMGDTRQRGKIIWMLLTCRPDLLPIDLKRQGRAEVHIPLFYPDDSEELADMFRIMARKNKIAMSESASPNVADGLQLSGADVESIVLAAWRKALADERGAVTAEDLQRAVDSFIPSAQGLEKELQEIAAVLECTDTEFLPAAWRTKLEQTEGRANLQERFVQIRQIVD